jgi:hypothetical protein
VLLDTQHLQSITLSHFPGKPTIGSDWPETGLEEVTGHVIEPDFGTAFYNQAGLALRFLPTDHFQLASVQ